jgi:hypothetical protein
MENCENCWLLPIKKTTIVIEIIYLKLSKQKYKFDGEFVAIKNEVVKKFDELAIFKTNECESEKILLCS